MSEKNYRVFILEDSVEISNLYLMVFKEVFNIPCDIFSNALTAMEALESYGTDRWCLFICDLKVPYSTTDYGDNRFYGFDLIEKYLVGKKVIVVSGYVSPEIGKIAFDLNICALHAKPININALLVSANFLLGCCDKNCPRD